MISPLQVQAIYIYPIKSLGGISLDYGIVEEKGFQYDRRWMLVDADGVFVSQRSYPKLALLQVQLVNGGLSVSLKSEPENNLFIPFEASQGKYIDVTIWDDLVEGQLVGEEFDTWFSQQLSKSVRLVLMPEMSQRKVDPRYAVHNESVSFADGMPYLLLGEESLNDLNTRLSKPVPMDRFRPNIVFSGSQAYSEDSWSELRIGNVDFRIVKPCARCVLTTVDQATGFKGKEPLKTLASYRTMGGKVLFGQNMVALSPGRIQVGDRVKIV